MTLSRLPTGLWLEGELRRLTAQGIAWTLIRRGDPTGGTVLVKLVAFGVGARLIGQNRDLDGRLVWWPHFQGQTRPEAEVDARLAGALDNDPDLWAVELEVRSLENPLGPPQG